MSATPVARTALRLAPAAPRKTAVVVGVEYRSVLIRRVARRWHSARCLLSPAGGGAAAQRSAAETITWRASRHDERPPPTSTPPHRRPRSRLVPVDHRPGFRPRRRLWQRGPPNQCSRGAS